MKRGKRPKECGETQDAAPRKQSLLVDGIHFYLFSRATSSVTDTLALGYCIHWLAGLYLYGIMVQEYGDSTLCYCCCCYCTPPLHISTMQRLSRTGCEAKKVWSGATFCQKLVWKQYTIVNPSVPSRSWWAPVT